METTTQRWQPPRQSNPKNMQDYGFKQKPQWSNGKNRREMQKCDELVLETRN